MAGSLVHGEYSELAADGALLVFWLTVAGLWGRNMVRAGPDTRRIHQAAMLAILGLVVGGAVRSAVGVPAGYQGLVEGVVNVVGIALLAYGILRHDLVGLDAKLEWSISKTTVAGVFVAVFFIVSEGAQVLFAGVVGSQLLGIIAAGALLFALSPIQRLADRVAARAVPGGAEAGADAEERYREDLRMALADGEISEKEEERLAQRAEEMGLGPKRALVLRREVEDEMDVEG